MDILHNFFQVNIQQSALNFDTELPLFEGGGGVVDGQV